MLKFLDVLAQPKALRVVEGVGTVFHVFPHIPAKIVQIFATLVQGLTFVGGVISGITSMIMIVLSILSLFTLDMELIFSTVFSTLLITLSAVVLLKSSILFWKKELKAWDVLFWGVDLGSISLLLEAYDGDIGWISAIVIVLVGFYIFFEVRSFSIKRQEQKPTTNTQKTPMQVHVVRTNIPQAAQPAAQPSVTPVVPSSGPVNTPSYSTGYPYTPRV